MFAKSIVLSDAFLDMPLSARCLYFTLGMLADDDGFIGNPKAIMRQCGASQDDMLVLLQKRYILSWESGVIVIKHWRMNNYLQNDRHKRTTYVDELETLNIDDRGAYTEKGKLINERIPDTYVEEHGNTEKEVADKKHRYGLYQKVLLTDREYQKLTDDYGEDTRERLINFLDQYIEEKGYKSKSHYLSIKRWVVDAVKEKDRKTTGSRGYSKADELNASYQMMSEWAGE